MSCESHFYEGRIINLDGDKASDRNILYNGFYDDAMDEIKGNGKEFDLIYLDPSYYCDKNLYFPIPKGDKFIFDDLHNHYDDKYVKDIFIFWGSGSFIKQYCEFNMFNLKKIHGLLKDGGYLVFHCSYASSHYIKYAIDIIFGHGAFVKSFLWDCAIELFTNHFYEVLVYRKGRVSSDASFPITRWDKFTMDEIPRYPTQKPEKFINFLINKFSKEGDLVGDFTCGSGVFLHQATNLGRRWIGCDRNDDAINVTLDHFKKYFKDAGFPDIELFNSNENSTKAFIRKHANAPNAMEVPDVILGNEVLK